MTEREDWGEPEPSRFKTILRKAAKILFWLVFAVVAIIWLINQEDPWKIVTFVLGGWLVGWYVTDMERQNRETQNSVYAMKYEISTLQGQVRRLEDRLSASRNRLSDQ